MLELSLEQMKRLAELTYPGRQVEIRDHRVYVRPSSSPGKLPDMVPFFPGLDRAQAYDVIVAAEKWAGAWEVYEQFNDEEKNQYLKGIVCDWKAKDMDLLHASALALLGDKT